MTGCSGKFRMTWCGGFITPLSVRIKFNMDIQVVKRIVGIAASVLTFLAYIPYYRDILKGKTRPHVYSWSLWALLTVLLVALQIKGGAGTAVLVTATAGLLCVGVVILSLKNGNKDITKMDTIVALLGLGAIVLWLIVKQPIASMIFVILADLFAFIPTIRKSWVDPYSETFSLYLTNFIRFLMALFAVNNYSFLSSAWILFWAFGNGAFALMLAFRRRHVKP